MYQSIGKYIKYKGKERKIIGRSPANKVDAGDGMAVLLTGIDGWINEKDIMNNPENYVRREDPEAVHYVAFGINGSACGEKGLTGDHLVTDKFDCVTCIDCFVSLAQRKVKGEYKLHN
jgi:hypothetical protein